MKATSALAILFFLPGDEKPIVRYFNAPVCDFHQWKPEAVKKFLSDNWEAVCAGFGLGYLPTREQVGWSWEPWVDAVEFWNRAQAEQQQQNPTTTKKEYLQ